MEREMLLCCYFIENILTRKKSFKELSNFRKPFEKLCELLSGGSGTFDSGKNFGGSDRQLWKCHRPLKVVKLVWDTAAEMNS